MENLEKLLDESKKLMKIAEKIRNKRGGSDLCYIDFFAIQAVYKQNEAIIELLKNYQNVTRNS